MSILLAFKRASFWVLAQHCSSIQSENMTFSDNISIMICPDPSSSIPCHFWTKWERKMRFSPGQRQFCVDTIYFDSSSPKGELTSFWIRGSSWCEDGAAFTGFVCLVIGCSWCISRDRGASGLEQRAEGPSNFSLIGYGPALPGLWSSGSEESWLHGRCHCHSVTALLRPPPIHVRA